MKRQHSIYIIIVAALYVGLTVVFCAFPRPLVSQLEKRELATFPEFSWQHLADGSFTKEVSAWFSDSEPFRDDFMTLSMYVKHLIALTPTDNSVRFHASTTPSNGAATVPVGFADGESSATMPVGFADGSSSQEPTEKQAIKEAESHSADEIAKIANAGIIVVGKGDKVRALMAYGGSSKGCVGYARAANKYKEVFGDAVNVYCMVIPTAVEFYCPDKARKCTNRQLPTIRNVFAHLDTGVKPVDVYTTLGEHADEDIFLRTDHHWAPLGGYYAAREFAKVAGVPFRDISHYERRVVRDYVGSMYGYSQDIAIKNAPEDFVYYVPKGVTYTTTYTNYTIDKDYRVVGVGKPFKAPFFFRYRDGHGGAYCTMMGGDTKLTQVRTSTHNGRRVIILKDSFGNMLPGFLFFSFEEVHVIDSRYFTQDIVAYVDQHHITDILFANNIFKAYSSHTYGAYLRFLHQKWQQPKAVPTTAPDRHSPSGVSSVEGTDSAPTRAELVERTIPNRTTPPNGTTPPDGLPSPHPTDTEKTAQTQ